MSKSSVFADMANQGVTAAEFDALDGGITVAKIAGDGTDGQVLTSTGASTAPAFENAVGGLYESIAIICDEKAYSVAGGTFTQGAWRQRDLNDIITDVDDIVYLDFTDATCDYNNDPTIAHNANTKMVVGMSVTGTGIPVGATISSVTSTTAFELSASTTGGAVTDGTLTFASNQFTLAAGTYTISWNAPCFGNDGHASRLYSSADGAGTPAIDHGQSQTGFSLKINAGVGNDRSFGIAVVTITATRVFRIEHRCQTSQTTSGFGTNANNIYPVGSIPYSRYTMVKILKHS